MLDKFNRMDNSKKVPIVIFSAVILIVLIIIFSVFRNQNVGYKKIKEYENKSLVYTINSKENGIFHIEVPYLNIKDSYAKTVNEDINDFVLDFIDNEKVILDYDYNVNGNILSLVIKVVDYSEKNIPKSYFKTYNINLDTKELLYDDQVLANFNVTSLDVSNKIEKQFMNWYRDVTEKGYVEEEECDYECFLKYKEVDDYLDDVSYYIENGNLVVYKPFVFYSIFGEEEYFKEDDFKFMIVKRES